LVVEEREKRRALVVGGRLLGGQGCRWLGHRIDYGTKCATRVNPS
jgi:hypothetical protein